MAFFKGIFGRFSGIFCPWMSYRSHILTQEYFFLKMWSLELYQETSYEIFIFDHIWGGGRGAGIWKLATGDFCTRSGPPQLGAVLVHLYYRCPWSPKHNVYTICDGGGLLQLDIICMLGIPCRVACQSEVGHQSRGAVEMNTPFDVSNVTPLTGKVTRHGLQHMGLFLRVGNRHIIESLWHYCLNIPEREW